MEKDEIEIETKSENKLKIREGSEKEIPSERILNNSFTSQPVSVLMNIEKNNSPSSQSTQGISQKRKKIILITLLIIILVSCICLSIGLFIGNANKNETDKLTSSIPENGAPIPVPEKLITKLTREINEVYKYEETSSTVVDIAHIGENGETTSTKKETKIVTDYGLNIYDSHVTEEDLKIKNIYDAFFIVSNLTIEDELGNKNAFDGYDPYAPESDSSGDVRRRLDEADIAEPSKDDFLKFLTDEQRAMLQESDDDTEFSANKTTVTRVPPVMKISFYENGTIISIQEAEGIEQIFLESMHEAIVKLIPQISESGYVKPSNPGDKEDGEEDNLTEEPDGEGEENEEEIYDVIESEDGDFFVYGENYFYHNQENTTRLQESKANSVMADESAEFKGSYLKTQTNSEIDEASGRLTSIQSVSNTSFKTDHNSDVEEESTSTEGTIEGDISMKNTGDINLGFEGVSTESKSDIKLKSVEKNKKITSVISSFTDSLSFKSEEKLRRVRRGSYQDQKETLRQTTEANRENTNVTKNPQCPNTSPFRNTSTLSEIIKPIVFEQKQPNFSLLGLTFVNNFKFTVNIMEQEFLFDYYITIGSLSINILPPVRQEIKVRDVTKIANMGKYLLQKKLQEFTTGFLLYTPSVKGELNRIVNNVNEYLSLLQLDFINSSPLKQTVTYITEAVQDKFSTIENSISFAGHSFTDIKNDVQDGRLPFISEMNTKLNGLYSSFVSSLEGIIGTFGGETLNFLDEINAILQQENIASEVFYENMKLIDDTLRFYKETNENINTSGLNGLSKFQRNTVEDIEEELSPSIKLINSLIEGLSTNRILCMVMAEEKRKQGNTQLSSGITTIDSMIDFIFQTLNTNGIDSFDITSTNYLYHVIKPLLERYESEFQGKSAPLYREMKAKTESFVKLNNGLHSMHGIDTIDSMLKNNTQTYFKNHFSSNIGSNSFLDHPHLDAIKEKFAGESSTMINKINFELHSLTEAQNKISFEASRERYLYDGIINAIGTQVNEDFFPSYINQGYQGMEHDILFTLNNQGSSLNGDHITYLISVRSEIKTHLNSKLDNNRVYYTNYFENIDTAFTGILSRYRDQFEAFIKKYSRDSVNELYDYFISNIRNAIARNTPSEDMKKYGFKYSYIDTILSSLSQQGINKVNNARVFGVNNKENIINNIQTKGINILNRKFQEQIDNKISTRSEINAQPKAENWSHEVVQIYKHCYFLFFFFCEDKSHLYRIRCDPPVYWSYFSSNIQTAFYMNTLINIKSSYLKQMSSVFATLDASVKASEIVVKNVIKHEQNVKDNITRIVNDYSSDVKRNILSPELGVVVINAVYQGGYHMNTNQIINFIETERESYNNMHDTFTSFFETTLHSGGYDGNNPKELIYRVNEVIESNNNIRSDGGSKVEDTLDKLIRHNILHCYQSMSDIIKLQNLELISTVDRGYQGGAFHDYIIGGINNVHLTMKGEVESEGNNNAGDYLRKITVEDAQDVWGVKDLGIHTTRIFNNLSSLKESIEMNIKNVTEGDDDNTEQGQEEGEEEGEETEATDGQRGEGDKFNNQMVKIYSLISNYESAIRTISDKSSIFHNLQVSDFNNLFINAGALSDITILNDSITKKINTEDYINGENTTIMSKGNAQISNLFRTHIPDVVSDSLYFNDGTLRYQDKNTLEDSFDRILTEYESKIIAEYTLHQDHITELNSDDSNNNTHVFNTRDVSEKTRSALLTLISNMIIAVNEYKNKMLSELGNIIDEYDRNILIFNQTVTDHGAAVFDEDQQRMYYLFINKIDLFESNTRKGTEELFRYRNNFYRLKEKTKSVIDRDYPDIIKAFHGMGTATITAKMNAFTLKIESVLQNDLRLLAGTSSTDRNDIRAMQIGEESEQDKDKEHEHEQDQDQDQEQDKEGNQIITYDYSDTKISDIISTLGETLETEIFSKWFIHPTTHLDAIGKGKDIDIPHEIAVQSLLITSKLPDGLLTEKYGLSQSITDSLDEAIMQGITQFDAVQLQKINDFIYAIIRDNYIDPLFRITYAKLELLKQLTMPGLAEYRSISEITKMAYEYMFSNTIQSAGNESELDKYYDYVERALEAFVQDTCDKNLSGYFIEIIERLTFECPEGKELLKENMGNLHKTGARKVIDHLTKTSFNNGNQKIKSSIQTQFEALKAKSNEGIGSVTETMQSKDTFFFSEEMTAYTAIIKKYKSDLSNALKITSGFSIDEANKEPFFTFIKDNIHPLLGKIQEEYNEIGAYIIKSGDNNGDAFNTFINKLSADIVPDIGDIISQSRDDFLTVLNEKIKTYIESNIISISKMIDNTLLDEAKQRVYNHEDDPSIEHENMVTNWIETFSAQYNNFYTSLTSSSPFIDIDDRYQLYGSNSVSLLSLRAPIEQIKQELNNIIEQDKIDAFLSQVVNKIGALTEKAEEIRKELPSKHNDFKTTFINTSKNIFTELRDALESTLNSGIDSALDISTKHLILQNPDFYTDEINEMFMKDYLLSKAIYNKRWFLNLLSISIQLIKIPLKGCPIPLEFAVELNGTIRNKMNVTIMKDWNIILNGVVYFDVNTQASLSLNYELITLSGFANMQFVEGGMEFQPRLSLTTFKSNELYFMDIVSGRVSFGVSITISIGMSIPFMRLTVVLWSHTFYLFKISLPANRLYSYKDGLIFQEKLPVEFDSNGDDF